MEQASLLLPRPSTIVIFTDHGSCSNPPPPPPPQWLVVEITSDRRNTRIFSVGLWGPGVCTGGECRRHEGRSSDPREQAIGKSQPMYRTYLALGDGWVWISPHRTGSSKHITITFWELSRTDRYKLIPLMIYTGISTHIFYRPFPILRAFLLE